MWVLLSTYINSLMKLRTTCGAIRVRPELAGTPRNRVGNAAFGDFVALVTIRTDLGVSGKRLCLPIDFRVQAEFFGINVTNGLPRAANRCE